MSSAIEIATAVRSGQITARKMVEQSLDRIQRENGPVNAFVYLDEQGALEAADGLDERIGRGEEPGPLAGVPFGIKDLRDNVAGMPMRNGSLITKDAEPDKEDSPQIARLKNA